MIVYKNSNFFIIYISLIQILILTPLFSQKKFSNLHTTPERWHERSLSMLRSINYEFDKKQKKKKSDSVVYFKNIASLYANLGESSDTVFYYVDKALLLDRKFGCQLLLSDEKIMKESKNGMYLGNLDSMKYLVRKIKCENFMKTLPISNIETIKSNPNYDQIMISKIDRMIESDQRYRFLNNVEKQQIYDNYNRILLDSIFTYYGYPGISKVSDLYSTYVATIFLHMGEEFIEKWIQLLIKTFKSGELDKGSIMLALDRLHMLKYEKQLFGTQRLSKNGEMIEVPKYNIKEQMEILRKFDLNELFNEVRE